VTTREILKPRNPSRQDILDTVGDQGEGHYRNPIHLREVTGKWPKRDNDPQGKERQFIQALEKGGPSTRNGSIK
jgi:hypothetical protein